MTAARKTALALTLLIVTVAIYWPALRGEFIWDDLLIVKKNPIVTGELTAASIWFRTDFPLSILGFWLQWLAWGGHPSGFHAVNLALHLANTVLLWRVLTRLNVPGCGLAAALFAVHPLCVASVAWISEFKNTLSLLFFLLSLWCWLRFTESPQTKAQSIRWYALTLIAFVLALLAKTSTVVLPVVLLALAWWQSGKITRRDILHVLPCFVLGLAFGIMTIWFQQHQLRLTENLEPQSFGSRIAIAGMALWFYLGKILFPLNLAAIYPRWQPDASSLVSYLPAVIWCAVVAICLATRKRWGLVPVLAAVCFTAALFPVLGFFNFYFSAISRVSDHFTYLPLIVVVTFLSAGLKRFLPQTAFPAVAVVIVVAFAALASQRARVYATDEALWRDTLAKNQAAWTAHNNLACILAEQNHMDDAMAHFKASLKLNPRNASAHLNLGRLLLMRRQFSAAELHLRSAVELKPADVDSRIAYAELLFAARKTGEAVAQSREALKLKPDQPDLLSNLAWVLATAADASLRDGPEAVRFAERACQLTRFEQAQMVGTLAAAYAEAGRFEEAVTTARKAIELANASGDRGFAAINQKLLQLYQSKRAYHEPMK